MKKLVGQYCREIQRHFKAGISTEHSYRADLQNLLSELIPEAVVTNEPKRQECEAPDFMMQTRRF